MCIVALLWIVALGCFNLGHEVRTPEMEPNQENSSSSGHPLDTPNMNYAWHSCPPTDSSFQAFPMVHVTSRYGKLTPELMHQAVKACKGNASDQLHILDILPLRRAYDTTGQEIGSASAQTVTQRTPTSCMRAAAAWGTTIRFSEVWRYAVSYMVINVSERYNVSIFREREAGTSSETMASIYETTPFHNPEGHTNLLFFAFSSAPECKLPSITWLQPAYLICHSTLPS
jgi:hypothetical protein